MREDLGYRGALIRSSGGGFVVAAVIPAVAIWMTHGGLPAVSGPSAALGACLAGAGALGSVWSTLVMAKWGFRDGWRGRGPTHLVVQGPYAYLRNPFAMGAAGMLVGALLLAPSQAFAAYAGTCVAVGYLHTRREEARLLRRLGAAYRRYQQTVPRWVPRRPLRTAGVAVLSRIIHP